MTRTKAAALLLVALIVSLPVSAQETRHEERTVPFEAGERVVIKNYKGSIDVATWQRPEAHVEVTLESDGDDRAVELTDIVIRKSNGRLEVSTDTESRRSLLGMVSGDNTRLPLVHIKVMVPPDADVHIEDYRSSIRVAGLQRGFEAETYRGTVEAKDITGVARVETYRGDVRLAGLRGGARVETYRGSVRAQFTSLEDDVRIETYRGDVELDLPRDAGFRLDVEQPRRASITSDFDLGSPGSGERIRRTVNGGGPLIRFETYRGQLALNAR